VTKIGTKVYSIDAVEKVSGSLKYASDFKLPGMLYGKVLRSPYSHARVVSIDTSKAWKTAGIRAVVTGQDYDLPLYSVAGVRNVDDRLLAGEKVRYIGDEVAAVAAVDEDAAKEAIGKIVVEYDKLEPVFDPEKAMREGAPLVHESIQNNTVNVIRIRHGNVKRAFDKCEAVVEATFTTPIVHQAYLEPHSAVAQWDFQGRLTLWIPTQSPRLSQITYAKALGTSPDKVRIIQMPMGGAFGGKLEYKLHPICALLAREANAPVKMRNSRKEEFTSGIPRLPMKIKMRAGCKKDGTITAKHTEIICDCGAYVNYSQGIQLSATTRHDNLYRLKNIHTDSYLVYTNTIPKGCFRGFGCPQSFFALESIIDMLANEIQMDPAEFRLRNASQRGDKTPHGWFFGSCGLSEAITRSTEKAGWKEKRESLPKKRPGEKAYGIGMACCLHVSGNRTFLPFFDGAAAYVRVDEEGKVTVSVGEPDLGQGSKTTFALIVAHELRIPVEWVMVGPVDTDLSPHGLGTFGDRSTTLTGNAVKNAALDAKQKILAFASKQLSTDSSDLVITDGMIFSRKDAAVRMGFAEAARYASFENAGGTVLGSGRFIPPHVTMVNPKSKVGNISCAYPFVAQVAEV
jgi:CO/xanthine dehydrogenase Mo-binding subunit